MIAQARWSAIKGIKPHEWAVRFFFGGAICVLAGLISKKFGPEIGGLFLAFPAIFPAGASSCTVLPETVSRPMCAGALPAMWILLSGAEPKELTPFCSQSRPVSVSQPSGPAISLSRCFRHSSMWKRQWDSGVPSASACAGDVSGWAVTVAGRENAAASRSAERMRGNKAFSCSHCKQCQEGRKA
jgi:hypothetical protein